MNGNQDPARHVIREDEWHGGLEAIEKRMCKNETQSAKPTVAHCIKVKAGIIKDGQIREEIYN